MQELLDQTILWFQTAFAQMGEKVGLFLTALFIILLGIYVSNFAKSVLLRGLRYRKADPETSLFVGRILQWIVIGGAILFSADQVGIDITAILTGLGILGFTLGFALQDVSKNFIAGLLILLQQPFNLGDTIEVSGFTGTILDINLRDTLLETADGLRVRIPNGEIFTQPVLNYTGVAKRRLQIQLSVSYDTNLIATRKLVHETLAAIPGVVNEPAMDVRFDTFGDTGITMNAFYWYDTKQTNYSEALNAGIVSIKEALDNAGVVIPVVTLFPPSPNSE